jgi:carbon storage regulator
VLVLTRRIGESIVIANNITVTVLEVRGEVVRLGIAAPREIAVHRQEVFDEVAAANRAAASPDESRIAALTKDLPTNGPATSAPADNAAAARPSDESQPPRST